MGKFAELINNAAESLNEKDRLVLNYCFFQNAIKWGFNFQDHADNQALQSLRIPYIRDATIAAGKDRAVWELLYAQLADAENNGDEHRLALYQYLVDHFRDDKTDFGLRI